MNKKNIKLFVAYPNRSCDNVEIDNDASYIQNRFNQCFESLGYKSNDVDRISYRDNSFDVMCQAIEKIRWSDIIIISDLLNKKSDGTLFKMIIDSGKSYLFESQLETIIYCFNTVEDCLNKIAKV